MEQLSPTDCIFELRYDVMLENIICFCNLFRVKFPRKREDGYVGAFNVIIHKFPA